MEAVAALLEKLPLQPEESDRGDLMEAKSQLFLKYVSFITVTFVTPQQRGKVETPPQVRGFYNTPSLIETKSQLFLKYVTFITPLSCVYNWF